MSDFSIAANPFAQLIAPQELALVVQSSAGLTGLRRHTVLRADKPRTRADVAAYDAEIDAADASRAKSRPR